MKQIINNRFEIQTKDYSFYVKDGYLFAKISSAISSKIKLERTDFYSYKYRKYFFTMRNNLEFDRRCSTFYMPGKHHIERDHCITLEQIKNRKEKLSLRKAIAWACKTYDKILKDSDK